MQKELRGSNIQVEYSEKYVIKQLKELYGNCIYIGENLYIVYSNGAYYLMQKTIPEVFDIKKAIKLRKVMSMEDNADGTTCVKIKTGEESKEIIFTTKPRLVERLAQWT